MRATANATDPPGRPAMLVSDFDYDLPSELVAQYPIERGASRLLVIDRRRKDIEHEPIDRLPAWLTPGDLLVVNDTCVFPARLFGRRDPSGGLVECLLLERLDRERWDCLMHPGQKLRVGARVVFEDAARAPDVRLCGEVLASRFYGRRELRLWAPAGSDVAEAIDALGHVPLPPYIKRSDQPLDRERYQTVYARVRGSVAAPTAGLHFTPDLLASLERGGIERTAVTLHVGYGTFKPLRTDRVEDHTVDAEPYAVSREAADLINRARDEGRRIVAVGTTTTRALETAVRCGGGRVQSGRAVTDLFIHPGFEFRVVGGLLTNFHLPRSSLLMLVAAFGGRERVLAAYREAVARRYRFYSYGDAMLIL